MIRTGLGAKRAADALDAIYFDDAVASLVARARRTNVDTGWVFAVITKARQRGDNSSVAVFVASFVLRNDRPKGACLDVVFHSAVHRARLTADAAREVDDHAVFSKVFGAALSAVAAIKTPAAAIKLRREPSVDCIFSPLNQNGFATLS